MTTTDILTPKTLREMGDRLREMHPELDPSWANLIGFYADAWERDDAALQVANGYVARLNSAWRTQQSRLEALQPLVRAARELVGDGRPAATNAVIRAVMEFDGN